MLAIIFYENNMKFEGSCKGERRRRLAESSCFCGWYNAFCSFKLEQRVVKDKKTSRAPFFKLPSNLPNLGLLSILTLCICGRIDYFNVLYIVSVATKSCRI